MLAKWSLKRNLSCADAAHILRLHLDAESRDIQLQIFFFNKNKTLADIRTYIKKSNAVSNDGDLLKHLSGELPPYIGIGSPCRLPCPTAPTPKSFANVMNTITDSNFRPSLLPVPGANRDSFGSQQTGSPWSFVEPDTRSSKVPSPSWVGLSTPLDEGVENELFDDSSHESLLLESLDNLGPKYKSLALDASRISPASFLAVTQPFVSPDMQITEFTCNVSFHGLLSASPIQAVGLPGVDETQGDVVTDPIRSILGNFWNCEQFNIFNECSWFLVSCIQGCIYRGQKQYGNADRRFADAIGSFEVAITQRREECLTLLTVLVALFESYGHRDVVKSILEGVHRVMSGRLGNADPMTRTVSFMRYTQSLEPGESGVYDINELVEIYNSLFCEHGAHSWLTLTAQYNVAWTQLENRNFMAARLILTELKPLCETAFGPLHLQSIICCATLARAQFRNGELQPAETLLEEAVVGRIKKVFTVSHPYYWEAQHRRGVFLIALSNSFDHLHKKYKSLRQTAEELLREVLLWRFTILGTANPRTTNTFHVLEGLLKSEGRHADAQALFYWCDNNCQRERDLLMGDKYVLT